MLSRILAVTVDPNNPAIPGIGPTAAPVDPALAANSLPTIVLTLLILATLVGALVVLFLPGDTGDDDARMRVTALFASCVPFVMTFFMTTGQMSSGDPTTAGLPTDASQTVGGLGESHLWLSSNPVWALYKLDIDGISLPLLMVSCLLFLAVFFMEWKREHRLRQHLVMLLIVESAVNGALLARDHMLWLMFLGMLTLPLYLLIRDPHGPARHDARRERAASLFLGFNLAAMALLVAGTLLIVTQAVPHLVGAQVGGAVHPTFDMSTVDAQTFDKHIPVAGFMLLMTGLLIMSGGFPFHRWMISVVGDADSGVAVLVAGITTRLGAYGILHVVMVTFPGEVTRYSTAIAALAVAGAAWGVFGAAVEGDLRRRIGYLCVVQNSLVLLGVAGVNQVSLVGGLLELITGGMTVGVLLLVAGAVESRTRHREIARLGGLALRAPRLTAFWVTAVLSSIGVPLLAGFTADINLFTGAFPQHRFATVAMILASIGSAAVLLMTTQRVFFGAPREHLDRVRDGDNWEYTALTPLLVLALLYGVLPVRVMGIIANGVNAVITTRLASGGP